MRLGREGPCCLPSPMPDEPYRGWDGKQEKGKFFF